MRTLLPSLIRTYVPLAVAWLAGFLLTLGLPLPTELQTEISSALGAVIAAGYYLVVRLLEKRYPWATLLLGSSVQPVAYLPHSVELPPAASRDIAAEQASGRHAADAAPAADAAEQMPPAAPGVG